MLLNTYTAKGRAAARTLSTSFLRDEMRLVAGVMAGISLACERGGFFEVHYPLRVARWVKRAVGNVPLAPDSARLTDASAVCCVTIREASGITTEALYYTADVWFLYRGLFHWSIGDRKRLRRQCASLRRQLRANEVAQLIYLASNGGEGRTV